MKQIFDTAQYTAGHVTLSSSTWNVNNWMTSGILGQLLQYSWDAVVFPELSLHMARSESLQAEPQYTSCSQPLPPDLSLFQRSTIRRMIIAACKGTMEACDPDLLRVEATHLPKRLGLRVPGQSEHSRHISEDRCHWSYCLLASLRCILA